MDRKKFGHIFYTLTYLPIQKIWTNLEKSLYLIWPLEIYICQFLAYVQNIFLKASIYELNSRITPSTDLLIILKAMFLDSKHPFWTKKRPKIIEKSMDIHLWPTYLLKICPIFFLEKNMASTDPTYVWFDICLKFRSFLLWTCFLSQGTNQNIIQSKQYK